MSKAKHATERLHTGEAGEGMLEHLHRYALAVDRCAGKTVLDIASGEGYGTNLLAAVAAQAVGVDIDAEAVDLAARKYAAGKKNLRFLQGSAARIPLEDGMFDVVVSFETIEHHDQHEEMMQEIKRVLKPGGLLVISSPDKHFYSEKPGTTNPFHVKELYKEEFEALLKRYFSNTSLYRQKTFFSSVIAPDHDEKSNLDVYGGNFESVKKLEGIEPVYLVALASDAAFEPLGSSIFRDYDFIANMKKRFESGSRFQLGNLILNPVQFFKQKFSGKK